MWPCLLGSKTGCAERVATKRPGEEVNSDRPEEVVECATEAVAGHSGVFLLVVYRIRCLAVLYPSSLPASGAFE